MEIARAILYRRIACNFHHKEAEKNEVKEMSKDAKLGLYVIGVAVLATIVSMGLGLIAG